MKKISYKVQNARKSRGNFKCKNYEVDIILWHGNRYSKSNTLNTTFQRGYKKQGSTDSIFWEFENEHSWCLPALWFWGCRVDLLNVLVQQMQNVRADSWKCHNFYEWKSLPMCSENQNLGQKMGWYAYCSTQHIM